MALKIRAHYYDLAEPATLVPNRMSNIVWFHAEPLGTFLTVEGQPVEAVNVGLRGLEVPAIDMIGCMGKVAMGSEPADAYAPRVWFWRNGFWVCARGETAAEFYGSVRVGATKRKAIALYPITIDESGGVLASISVV